MAEAASSTKAPQTAEQAAVPGSSFPANETRSMSATAEPTVARGVLEDEGDGWIDFSIPGTDYRLRLLVADPMQAAERSLLRKKIRGVIRADARRIDVVATGGRYVEPVYGRPRRAQGKVVHVDPSADTVTIQVHASCPIVCKTNGLQRASDFKVGQLVSTDLAPGATFRPTA